MKKWLIVCILAMALLFVSTTAMADHRKANGENCIGQSFLLLNATESEHTLHCYTCYEEFTEAHTVRKAATCIKKAECVSCPKLFGDLRPHDWGGWTSNGDKTHTRVCKHTDVHTETKDCTFSTARCAVPAPCTECGAVYSLEHA